MIEILTNASLLLLSIVALIIISGRLIDHSVRLAKILGISGAVIGLTLLAYGTSIPEFAVSSVASFQGHGQLSVSNVIGSNIYNIAIVIGIVSLLVPFTWKYDMRRDGLFMVFCTLLLIPVALVGGIGAVLGLGMMSAVLIYSYHVIRSDKGRKREKGKLHGSAAREFLLCCLFLAIVMLAGSSVVHFSVAIARLSGISEWLIGATIVAAGTSMPETVVSIMSARKRQMGMSLGNIVGSNYFNIMWVLGFSSVAAPLSIPILDVWVHLTFLSAVTILFYIAITRKRITRWEGLLYLLIYSAYIIYSVSSSA